MPLKKIPATNPRNHIHKVVHSQSVAFVIEREVSSWARLGWLGWLGWLGRAGLGWAGWAGARAGPEPGPEAEAEAEAEAEQRRLVHSQSVAQINSHSKVRTPHEQSSYLGNQRISNDFT